MSLPNQTFWFRSRAPTTDLPLRFAFPDRHRRLLSFSVDLTLLSSKKGLHPKKAGTAAPSGELRARLIAGARLSPQAYVRRTCLICSDLPALSCYYVPKRCVKSPRA